MGGLRSEYVVYTKRPTNSPVLTETGIYETLIRESAFTDPPELEPHGLLPALERIERDANALVDHAERRVRLVAGLLIAEVGNARTALRGCSEMLSLIGDDSAEVNVKHVLTCVRHLATTCLLLGEQHERMHVLTREHRALAGLKQTQLRQRQGKKRQAKGDTKRAERAAAVAAEIERQRQAGERLNYGNACQAVADSVGCDLRTIKDCVPNIWTPRPRQE